jgi:hypothetical protein
MNRYITRMNLIEIRFICLVKHGSDKALQHRNQYDFKALFSL